LRQSPLSELRGDGLLRQSVTKEEARVTIKAIVAATAVVLLSAGSAQAGILHYEAVLKGANETPANASHARGELTASLDLDRHTLDYSVTYSGLSGPATTAGFQRQGASAGVAAPASLPGKSSESDGQVQLTRPQIDELNAGRWTFNISTMASPGGEISGKIMRSSEAY
jgi:hypothetical protein